jgi:hypothetical protein
MMEMSGSSFLLQFCDVFSNLIDQRFFLRTVQALFTGTLLFIKGKTLFSFRYSLLAVQLVSNLNTKAKV